MTNGDQVQGGGGQRTYSEEDVLALMNETAKRAVAEATKAAEATRTAEATRYEATRNAQKINDEDDNNASVINPKVVRQLKDTVAVFTALKDLSSNPLQKTIEETVGGMAASVVQSAFSPRGPPPKQDIIDKLLNSQFAYGLGSGLGQRAPELVETMGRTFGTEKAGQMMDNIIGKYGTTGPSRQINPGPSSGSSSPQSPPEQKVDKQQSEKELLLSLDPNNPEHVSAYAETQGGLPVDVARKMLMIHQDAFIEQLKRDGMNVDQISTQRGSRAQPSQPAQQPSTIQHAAQSVSPIREDIPPTRQDSYSDNHIEPPLSQPHNSIEYADAEYNDVIPDHDHNSNLQRDTSQGNADGQQIEIMKTFATDIGKVMGDMLNKIETLNNTVFTLQSEMNDMKIRDSSQPSSVYTETPLHTPGMANGHMTKAPSTNIETPSLETFEDKVIKSPRENLDIERPDFFEEDVMDVNEFKQELEGDTKLSAQKKLQQTSSIPAQPIQAIQPAPNIQPVPPMKQPAPNIQMIHTEQVQSVSSTVQQTDKENNDDKENTNTPKNESIVTESEELKETPIISDNKASEEKNDNGFMTPTDQQLNKDLAKNRSNIIGYSAKADSHMLPVDQLELSKKTGIHNKAMYRNVKPLFKKNDEKENKEDSNV